MRKNHYLSDKAKAFNAKLAPKFSEAIIRKKVGDHCYILNDLIGKNLGLYHRILNARKIIEKKNKL